MAENKACGSARSPDFEALALMPAGELRAIWRERRGAPPPSTLSARLMRFVLAWDMQAEEHGGETPVLRRQWQAIMVRRAKGASAETAAECLAPLAVGDGTRLLKTWAGETHEVIVTDDGAVWNGTTYSSLSAVARAMTGTPRNGPKFFGLRETAS